MIWPQNNNLYPSLTKQYSHRHPITTPYSQRQLSTKKPVPGPTLWKTLKAPVLFGVGLYFGMMIFGEHQETKQGSSYFEALRYLFWSGDGPADDNGNGKKKGDET